MKNNIFIHTMDHTADLQNPKGDLALIEYVSMYKPNIQVLTYCPSGMCTAQYTLSLIRTVELCSKYNINIIIDIERNADSYGKAMNDMIARSLVHPDMTHVLFIDSDISWDAKDILALLMADKPMIAGIPPNSGIKWEKLLQPLSGSTDQTVQTPGQKLDNMIQKIKNPIFTGKIHPIDMIQYNLSSYDVAFASNELSVTDNMTTVESVSTKFMMVKRMVFESMYQAFPSIKYKYGHLTDMMRAAAAMTRNESEVQKIADQYGYNFFQSTVENGEYISEQKTFLQRWKNMNGSVHVHFSIGLTVVSQQHQNGNNLASLIS